MSQRQIAKATGVSQPMIAKDLAITRLSKSDNRVIRNAGEARHKTSQTLEIPYATLHRYLQIGSESDPKRIRDANEKRRKAALEAEAETALPPPNLFRASRRRRARRRLTEQPKSPPGGPPEVAH